MSAHGRKGKHGGDHENHERWLLTYADMITLLVAFFIMLYAMSVTNSAKFNSLAISVRSGFGNVMPSKPSILDGMGAGTPKNVMTPNLPVKPSTALGMSKDGPNKDGTEGSKGAAADNGEKAKKVLEQLKKLLAQGDMANHVSVTTDERGIIVTVLADKFTFDSGSADLKPSLKPVLDRVSSVIKSERSSVRIEGHTDDRPISNSRFPSNWQLSATRAANVLCYFVETDGVSPDKINCVGYADQRPIVRNTTEENRARNRRVEIVILDDNHNSGSVDSPPANRPSGDGAGIVPSFKAQMMSN